MRPPGSARCAKCHAPSEGYCCCTQTDKGPTFCEHPQPTHKTQRDTSTKTERPTRLQRTHNRRTNKESAQNNTNDGQYGGEKAYSPIPSNKVSTSRQSHLPDCEHPSYVQNPRDRRPLNTTHRHPTPRRSRLPSLQSRQNLLDRNQQDTTRKDSTKQRNRGNVAQGNTNRPQQTKIHNNGTRHTARGAVGQGERGRAERSHNTCHQVPTDTAQKTEQGKGKPRTAFCR